MEMMARSIIDAPKYQCRKRLHLCSYFGVQVSISISGRRGICGGKSKALFHPMGRSELQSCRHLPGLQMARHVRGSDKNNELEAIIDDAMVASRIRNYYGGLRHHLHEAV